MTPAHSLSLPALAQRRSFLRWAAVSMLVGTGATRALARPTPADAFLPPARPMQFTRLLERPLGTGYRFMVERAFAVRFSRDPEGFVLTGAQTAVEVDAPARLAELAGLERQRVEQGLFPLRLDASGLIDDVARTVPTAGVEQALAATRAVLAKAQLDAGDQAEAARFMALVHTSAASFLSRLPIDLFAPSAAHRVEERALQLPNGAGGIVKVEFQAQADAASGVMQRAEREITTTIEGESRVTRETWTLAPLETGAGVLAAGG
ncbi:hypothetical protein [Tsuneonella sp. HG222]